VCDEGLVRDLPATVSTSCQDGVYALGVTAPHLAVPALLERLQSRGLSLSRLTTRHVSLEDVFVALTGRKLRDEGETEEMTS
jgi:ABC-2 type transport system ATP-binding protein